MLAGAGSKLAPALTTSPAPAWSKGAGVEVLYWWQPVWAPFPETLFAGLFQWCLHLAPISIGKRGVGDHYQWVPRRVM